MGWEELAIRQAVKGRELFQSPGYRFHAVVTTLASPPEEVWRTYNGRADSENRIKELKSAFGADGFCFRRFCGTRGPPSVHLPSLQPGRGVPAELVGHVTLRTLATLRTTLFTCGAPSWGRTGDTPCSGCLVRSPGRPHSLRTSSACSLPLPTAMPLRREGRMRSTATFGFNVANAWDSSSDDRTQSVGAGLNATLIPNRLTLNLGYNYSRAKGKILITNPNTIEAKFRAGAQAFPFPDTKSELHNITAILNYKLYKNITIDARYAFEQYCLNDFAWDILQPYIFPNTADNPTRFLLLDSRHSNYDVHVFGRFIRVQF